MNSTIRCASWVALTGMVGLVLGYSTAMMLLRTDIEVDYDSGRCRQVTAVGPFVLRTVPYRENVFGMARSASGLPGLTGIPNWQLALRFWRGSFVSDSYAAGIVLNDITKLDQLPWSRKPSDLSPVKQQFLEALATGGPEAAHSVTTQAVALHLSDLMQ
jgi:hypothetical protein